MPRSSAQELRLAIKQKDWSPPAPASGDITVEGDEVYAQGRREPSLEL